MAFDYMPNGQMFVNPFTFVPYDRKSVERKGARQGKEKISGYLDCRLTVKTPLAIPDAEKAEGNYYPFFSVKENGEEQYRIPGSSIRGMLRSVYEAVTNSCFSTMREETLLSKRAGVRDNFRAGILIRNEDGEWKLYEAEKYLVPCANYTSNRNWDYLRDNGIEQLQYKCVRSSQERVLKKEGDQFEIRFGDPVEFRVRSMSPHTHSENNIPIWKGIVETIAKIENRKNEPEAYMFVGEPFRRKHGEEVFKIKKDRRVNGFSPDQIHKALDLLKESLQIYRNASINKEYGRNHLGYAGFERAERNGAIPLWYNVAGKRQARQLQFSLAYAGRISYKNTLNEIVGEGAPCQSREKVCKACDLFGMAGNGNEALGSRIRITDAVYKYEEGTCKAPICPKVTLKELGTPRYSYMNFYSTSGRRTVNGGSIPANSYDENGADIRGRKFYWHHKLDQDGKLPSCEAAAAERNALMWTFDLMESGSFVFRIYYDEITDDQLKELMWCITLGENKETGLYWHKIGHGKPLGLGSCKVTIEKRVNRSYQMKTDETQTDGFAFVVEKNAESLKGELNSNWTNALLKACNSQALGNGNVCYPYIDNSEGIHCGPNAEASHQWFKKFKEKRRALPDIMCTDQDQQLPVYKIVQRQNQGNRPPNPNRQRRR